MDKNVGKLCEEDADGQVGRAASHFMLCAFAGKLATKWDLLPWEKGEALRAIKKCFQAWLSVRGVTKAMEETEIIKRTKLFIERHGASRFQSVGDGKDLSVRDRVGFKLQVKGQTRYLFLSESFQSEICEGQNSTQVAKILERNGMLVRDGDGFLCKAPRELPGIGRQRCYHIVIPAEKKQ